VVLCLFKIGLIFLFFPFIFCSYDPSHSKAGKASQPANQAGKVVARSSPLLSLPLTCRPRVSGPPATSSQRHLRAADTSCHSRTLVLTCCASRLLHTCMHPHLKMSLPSLTFLLPRTELSHASHPCAGAAAPSCRLHRPFP
jgi:hypothetical protein